MMPSVAPGGSRPGPTAGPPAGRGRRTAAARWALLAIGVALIGSACTTGGNSPPPTGPTSGATPSPVTSEPETTQGSSTSSTAEGMGPETGAFVPFRTTQPDSADGKRVGLIGLNQASSFSKSVSSSIEEQLAIAGAEFVYCDSEANAEVALGCARRFAAQGVDAYLTLQPVAEAGQAICDAGPPDVPVIAIDSLQGDCEAARVGVNNHRVGHLAGVELGRFAQGIDCEYDTLLLITDSSLGPAAESRVEGIEEGFALQCPGEPHDLRIIDAPSQDVAYSEVTKLLTTVAAESPATTDASDVSDATDSGEAPATTEAPASGESGTGVTTDSGPSVDASATETTVTAEEEHHVLVAGVTDAAVLGALAAAKAAGREDVVDAVGLGAAAIARCGIATNPHWIGDVAFFPERYGEVAVPYLIDLLNGKQVPEQLFVESTFVNAETISEHYDVSDCTDGA